MSASTHGYSVSALRPRARHLAQAHGARLAPAPPGLGAAAHLPRAVRDRHGAGVLGDPQPHRAEPGRSVLLPGPARTEHRHRAAARDRHRLARPPHPARRGAGAVRAVRHARPRRPHPAGLDHQRRARVDRASAAGSPSSPASSPRSRSSWAWRCCWPRASTRATGSPRPPHGRPGARPGRAADRDRHADAGPRLGDGDGGDRARRAAGLRRVQPLGRSGCRRRVRSARCWSGSSDCSTSTRSTASPPSPTPPWTRRASATTPTRRGSRSARAG